MHTMTLVNEHEDTGEWLCPTCGRHLLIRRDPVFKKTVLVDGDPSTNHIRIKKKLQTGDQRDDPRLIPWLEWMDESGFENLWSSNVR